MQLGHERFPLFDGLRALAATLAFAFHAWVILGVNQGRSVGQAVDQIGVEATRDLSSLTAHLGEVGVALFYLLSAFLLYRPFARNALADGDPVELKSYAIRRLARIVPAYWVVLTVIGLAEPDSPLFTWHGLINQYLFLGIWNPEGMLRTSSFWIASWTVQVEMSFYVFLPIWAAGMTAIRRRVSRPLRAEMISLALLACIGAAWKIVAANRISGQQWFGSTFAVLPSSIDIFAVGMALALASVVATRRWVLTLRRIGSHAGACWTAAAAIYLLLCWVGDERGPFDGTLAANALGSGFAKGVIAFLIMLPAIWGTPGSGLIGRFLSARAVVWIGTVSYGLYLWHVVVIRRLGDSGLWGHPGPFKGDGVRLLLPEAIAAYAITLVIASASWYLLERRVLAAGHRLSRRLQSPAARSG